MNIIFDTDSIDTIKASNVVLELDTFYFSKLDKTATAFCVVENINIIDIDKVEQKKKLHAELIGAYKQKDFKLCKDLIESLLGSFNGELDSFYTDMHTRLDKLLSENIQDNWSPIICRED
jgi:hypothetical protein